MSGVAIHSFFDRECHKWNITDFVEVYLSKCDPGRKKFEHLGCMWTESLDNIIGGLGQPNSDNRRKKAEYLRGRYDEHDHDIARNVFDESAERQVVYFANSVNTNVFVNNGQTGPIQQKGTAPKRDKRDKRKRNDSSDEGGSDSDGTQSSGDKPEKRVGWDNSSGDLNHILKAFNVTYSGMFLGRKWKLRTGRNVEDILYSGAILLDKESQVHSWVLDFEDPWTKNLFTVQEWQEIMWQQVHNRITLGAFPAPKCLNSISDDVITTSQLRDILFSSPPQQGEVEEWVDAVYRQILVLLEQPDKPLIQPHCDVWLEVNLWSCLLGRLLLPLEGLVTKCKESSIAVRHHKNRNRTKTGKGNYLLPCPRLDGIFRGTGPYLEYGAYEVGKQFGGTVATKWIDDLRKLVVALSHMLHRIYQDVNVTRSDAQAIQVVGLMFSGLTCQSFRLRRQGYVGILLRDEQYTVPTNSQRLKDLSPLLRCLWQMKQTISDCMTAVLSASSNRN